ncbi:MAG: hypothetical protein R3C26_14340 [Calditrichia bacterium]
MPLILLIAIVFCYESLHAQGFSVKPTDPHFTPIFEQTYQGFERYAIDSVLTDPKLRGVIREVSLDSTQKIIIIEEKLNNRIYRMPVAMDLDYYVQQRLKHDTRRIWRQSIRQERDRLSSESGGGGIELNIPVKIKSKTFRRIFGGDRVGLGFPGTSRLSWPDEPKAAKVRRFPRWRSAGISPRNLSKPSNSVSKGALAIA